MIPTIEPAAWALITSAASAGATPNRAWNSGMSGP